MKKNIFFRIALELVIIVILGFLIYLQLTDSMGPNKELENLTNSGVVGNVTTSSEEISEEIPLYNNPPITEEDYIHLLGEVDYNKTYDLFFSATENDSALNYSEDPIGDVLYYLDRFIYWGDDRLYGVDDYWASPEESLESMKGDDEDAALLALALHKNFKNKNQTCYLVGNTEFTGVFCYEEKWKKYYGKTVLDRHTISGGFFDDWWQPAGDVWTLRTTLREEDRESESLLRTEIRNFIKDFMIDQIGYCCTGYPQSELTYSNRTVLTFLFNEEEFYEFETTKDFENWIYNKVTNL